MASSCPLLAIFMTLALVASIDSAAGAGLTSEFYARSCPNLFSTVRPIVQSAIDKNPRMGACLLRLFFHDCFVNGCDASLLLDDVPPFFIGEKNVHPNKVSACGFKIIDQIKNAVERACPGLVSCADLVAIAARDSVGILGGPKWEVQLGRKDAKTTNPLVANISIPTSSASLKELIIRFGGVALSTRDLVALSGAHTLGQAQCHNFRKRIYNESNIDKDFAEQRRAECPRTSGNTNLAPIDGETPYVFDNSYYKNLVKNKGLLHSDQQLFSGGRTDALVKTYSVSQESFFMDFVSAMLKMGSINPLIGPAGEVRILCRRINPLY
ncbi:PREDICTED: peroxidase P7-like [Fragaria vesca subsp. vesca]|uniref:peroxidase P7-like n=1 Tax=Fragaria vesca subsp. vesca TaxID=101020 RepID=UPI0002C2F6AF|nr:PREDICTED: peroxidase P7-like [Fragaria vesca subsp. vesca]